MENVIKNDRGEIVHIQNNYLNPLVFSTGDISLDCVLDNADGWMIADKKFINDMQEISLAIRKILNTETTETIEGVIKLTCYLRYYLINYFYKTENKNPINDNERAKIIHNLPKQWEDDEIKGTNLSDLKGINIARCMEFSIANYIILYELYRINKIKYKPFFVMSSMRIKPDGDWGRHVFLVLDNENDEKYKHLLYDTNNKTVLSDINGKLTQLPGLFLLTVEQRRKVEIGDTIAPKSIYPDIYGLKDTTPEKEYSQSLPPNKKVCI